MTDDKLSMFSDDDEEELAQLDEVVPDSVRKWLSSTFASQDQVKGWLLVSPPVKRLYFICRDNIDRLSSAFSSRLASTFMEKIGVRLRFHIIGWLPPSPPDNRLASAFNSR
jgi:hypothetical protein